MTDQEPETLWQKLRRHQYITDSLGVLLIILSGLLGWLPGPGGMPLFYAGLRMLAIHHPWAQRLLDYIINEGTAVLDKVFPERRAIMLLWDTFVVIAVSLGVYLLLGANGRLTIAFATALSLWGVVAFARNRNRYSRAKNRIRSRRAK